MIRILIILLFLSSCTRVVTTPPITIHDTTFVPTVVYDTIYVGSGRRGCDSLRRRLNTASYRLARIRYYYNICRRNPSQTKFLMSWIGRPLE